MCGCGTSRRRPGVLPVTEFRRFVPRMGRLTNLIDSATAPALSPDGRMLAFIRGPDQFVSKGEIYLKLLPEGAPVQPTHADTMKMSPVFSPDGSQIAYTVPGHWDTWIVPT